VVSSKPLIPPPLRAPPQGFNDWIGISTGALPVEPVLRWAIVPGCGGLVTFCGTVRDYSTGRPAVTALEYEAYEEYVVPRLRGVANSARERWAQIGRLALIHRIGHLEVEEVAVVVAVSTPHRSEAFEAASFCIDTLKHTVPIWKRETWKGGADWTLCTNHTESQPAPIPRQHRG
jgi:molybdopterin synthase catalytic subunit